ncbi:hypothetical protein OAM79_02635 [Litorivicinus sp.]|nr:hypothetical protein [Litorivicinus sp.]
MKTITLPFILKPQMDFPLIRVGSTRDGGYLVDRRLLGRDLLSFGIAGDWQFEKDWLAHSNNEAQIVTYDGSIGSLKFIGKALASSCRLHKPTLAFRNWANVIDYHKFLKSKTTFHRKFITHNLSDQSNETFANAMQYQKLDHPLFLKIDIEGAEYQLLNAIVQSQQNIAGLAIEFHKPLSNIEAISNFVRRLSLNVVNVHPNNCLPKQSHEDIEPSIEISFSHLTGTDDQKGLPHPLEQDNDPTCQPISIRWHD